MKKSLAFVSLAIFACMMAMALDANVVSVSGKVEVQNGNDWVAVKAGDVLKKGDVISTGFKSNAVIQINETRVTVGALARLTIEQLASDNVKDETSLFLDSGKIIADVQHKEKRVSFKVTSPVATASVRGSMGIFDGQDLTALEGGWAFGPSNQTSANVQDQDVTGDFTPPEGASNVFTSTGELSSEPDNMTLVLAGQRSSTDILTGNTSSTQTVAISSTQINTAGGGTISAAEGEKHVVSEIATGATNPVIQELDTEFGMNISVVW